jgi:hypothetical protein
MRACACVLVSACLRFAGPCDGCFGFGNPRGAHHEDKEEKREGEEGEWRREHAPCAEAGLARQGVQLLLYFSLLSISYTHPTTVGHL